mmetsp:Transcript_29/g.70  ORF Transcript_29/g.70 Transcript_29/m.70 type:complete len:894 (-) Transcript_29:155-2836(-)
MKARISGLMSGRGQSLNGKMCKITGFDSAKARFLCKVHGVGGVLLLKEENLEFMDLPEDSEAKVFTTRDCKSRSKIVSELEVPKVLVVKGDTFDYQGKYILQTDKHDGKPVWKCEALPRYLSFHSLGYWLLGTFGPDSPDPDDLCGGEKGLDGGRQVLGGFAESTSGWVQGFHFRARSFADTPDLIPRSRWEEWRPEGIFRYSDFGWFPTQQVRIYCAGRPLPLLHVEVQLHHDDSDEEYFNGCKAERAELFSGMYVLQSCKAGDLPVWKCGGLPEAELQDASFAMWESCQAKLLQYSFDKQAWLLSWMNDPDEYLYAKSAQQLPEFVDIHDWRMVSPGYRQKNYSSAFCVYIKQPEDEIGSEEEMQQDYGLRMDEIMKGAPAKLQFWDSASKIQFYLQPQVHHEHPVWKSSSASEWPNTSLYYDNGENFWVIGGEDVGSIVARYRVKSWAPFPHLIPDSSHKRPVDWQIPRMGSGGRIIWQPKPASHIVGFEIIVEEAQHQGEKTDDPTAANLGNPSDAESFLDPGESTIDVRCSLITYSRSTKKFRAALLKGPELAECRDALQGAGLRVELHCGAHIFVRPEYYKVLMGKLESYDLKPRHVVVAPEFEENLTAAIRSLPSKEQTRPKGDRVELRIHTGGAASSGNPNPQAFPESSVNVEGIYEVQRTFIQISVPSSLYSGPSSAMKTASTGDANPRVVVQPRTRKFGNRELKHFAMHAHGNERSPAGLGSSAAAQTGLSAAERAKWIKKINDPDTLIMHAISTAPERVRGDKEIMLAAICRPGSTPYGDLLMYAPRKLRADRDFIMRCVEYDAGVLDFTTAELKQDFDLVLHAAKHDGWNTLRFADPKFRDNRSVVLEALSIHPHASGFVSPSLQHDPEVLAVKRRAERQR